MERAGTGQKTPQASGCPLKTTITTGDERIGAADSESGVRPLARLCAYVNANQQFQEYDRGDQRIE
jgi:hypothetical protein